MIDVEKVKSAITDLLLATGVGNDEHTEDTPGRVARAWAESLAGYDEDPAAHLRRRFPAPSDPGLVIVAGIRLVSTCAHHLLPITGVATVAYRPCTGSEVVGLSKLARVVHGYARRLQVQERIGYQVTTAVQEELSPVGAACFITAAHGCMEVRGVKEPASVTTTHAMSGQWVPGHPDVVAVLAEHAQVRR
ncbi:GTP cyclohydrolase 1 [Mycobacteroides salmoniphilum]|uniref:GTP cyclohydrolase 1 n=1 Tax=Mycobacteroides salmoniphilum TaxID=404941 RepID=A0A4R8SA28_9MYCO|nr:GTP cyclohydrolase I [Mycobacteroides salmoniphilum]TDZ85980.1 GTP cyclohydrolase 1 [Mycobacteroides salmoniphilum]TDZ90171.1 GTP cyclohydrolase 1 [Mycobacteroides salmoniphilum]TEA00137.1 GTP cyclohydrolase 1 [Mycobacteroides salmoniphilum]